MYLTKDQRSGTENWDHSSKSWYYPAVPNGLLLCSNFDHYAGWENSHPFVLVFNYKCKMQMQNINYFSISQFSAPGD